MELHRDAILREQIIARYLGKSLPAELCDQFEDHYLGCDDCFEELRATELLMYGLGQANIERTQSEDITVIRFAGAAQLIATSLDLSELVQIIKCQKDTKVLIDLNRVSRIDSAGLGMLMNCYCHAVRNEGALKLLNPNAQVKRILNVTKISSVLQTFVDEETALASFEGPETRPTTS
jgi:anti-anti-sigma factor